MYTEKLRISPVYLLIPLSVLSAVPTQLQGQATSGVPGYVRVPKATFNEEATLYFGGSYLPRNYLRYTSNTYDALTVFASLTFLSFIEVDLRVSRPIGMPDELNYYTVDRMPSVRFRILKEKKWIPAVAIGIHDVLTSVYPGGPRLFGASYLVATKNFHLTKLFLNVETTLGYGTNWWIWQNYELVGVFGAVALRCDKVPWVSLMFDYDGEIPNAGVNLFLFKHLSITAGFLNFSSFTGSISYQFKIKK